MKKRLIALLSFLLTFLCMAQNVKAENIVPVNPESSVIITITDEKGNVIDNDSARMTLYNSDAKVVAKWRGNDASYLASSYKMNVTLGFKRRLGDIIPRPAEKDAMVKYVRLGMDYDCNYEYTFYYGEERDVTVRYRLPEETVLTVPAGKILFNVDSRYQGRTGKYGIGIGPDTDNDAEFYFNDMAGQEVLVDMDPGSYKAFNLHTYTHSGSAGSGGSITVKDVPTHYIRKTINLSECSGGYFEEDGTYINDDVVYDFTKETEERRCTIYIVSGSVVNAVLPDENGNVTIYVEESSYAARYSTGYYYRIGNSNGSAGGVNGSKFELYNTIDATFRSMSVPETGIALVGLAEGEYTLFQEDAITGYKQPIGVNFTVTANGVTQKVNVVNETQNGLYKVGDVWYYYVDGAVATDYTGFVDNGAGKWYVEKGILTGKTTGLYRDGADWYYVVNSKVAKGHSGIVRNSGGWWYVKDGKIDTQFVGIYKNDGGYWYIRNGKIDMDFVGLIQYANNWWYIRDGKIQENFTGLVNYNGSWWYVKNGKVQNTFVGLVNYNGEWWYIQGGRYQGDYYGLVDYAGNKWLIYSGKLSTSYMGLYKYGNDWWYVRNGKVVSDFEGMVSNRYEWWYVKNGKVQTNYNGLVEYDYNLWFVTNGKVNTAFSGLGLYNGVWYCVQSGWVNMSYTGLVKNGGEWWYVKKGILDIDMTGIVETGGEKWLVATGKLQSGYTGNYVYNGVSYRIVNGKVQ